MIKNKEYLYLSIIGIVTLFIGTFFDLALSQFLVNQNSIIAKFFEYHGLLIPFIIAFFAISIIYYRTKIKAVYAISVIIAIYSSMQNLKPYLHNAILSLLIGIILHGLIIAGIHFWLSTFDKATIRKYFLASIIFVTGIIISVLFVRVLKLINMRIRYRDLADVDQFTRWYQIGKFNLMKVSASFPSGHTSTMASLLLADLFVVRKQRLLVQVIAIGLVMMMFFSRVLIGAHYLSDVSFSLIVMSIVVYFLRKIYDKFSN